MGHPQPGSLSLFFRGRLGTPLGALAPLLVQRRAQVGKALPIGILAGILVMLIGITLPHGPGRSESTVRNPVQPRHGGRYEAARSSGVGAFSLYGMRATYMARFGTPIGRDLFQIFMILSATLAGVFSGEWRFAPRSARTLLVLSVICVSGATSLSAYANR